jgi:hypothetical protein
MQYKRATATGGVSTICKQSRRLATAGERGRYCFTEGGSRYDAVQTDRAMTDDVMDLYFDQGLLF